VIFNKPMDPVQASNVKNYSVYSETLWQGTDWTGLFPRGGLEKTFVSLKSAEYDAAANTVMLIPRRPLTYRKGLTLWTQARPARAAHGLVDLEGHPIRPNMTRGRFIAGVANGYTLTGYT
jgi:hypothetical protein